MRRLSSTTFDSQLDVATRVAQESPDLYFEIQSLNDYGAESLEALSKAVERIRTAVLSQDHEAFVALMQRGRDYLEDRRTRDANAGPERLASDFLQGERQGMRRPFTGQRRMSTAEDRLHPWNPRTGSLKARLGELTDEVGPQRLAAAQDAGARAGSVARGLAAAAARAD